MKNILCRYGSGMTMKPFNWLRLRRLVERLDAIRQAFNLLSNQPFNAASRIAVEEALAQLEREIDAEVTRVTAARLQQDLQKRIQEDLHGLVRDSDSHESADRCLLAVEKVAVC